MAYRIFEGVAHAESYFKFRPSYPADLFQKILSFLREKRPPPNQLLVDVGCGSGQGTYGLSSQFERVIGFDVSTAQVEAARKANTATNVEFKVSEAETLPLEDNTVDLITCSQAVHWFDFKAFCQECKRVLKPNGCLAITNYGNFWCDHKDEDIRNKLAEYFDELYNKELGTFWNEKRRLVEDKLEGIEIPFQDFVRDDSVEIRLQWSVSHLTGYLRSWSAYQKYLEVNPSGQIIEEYQKKIGARRPSRAELAARDDMVMSAVSSPDASPDDTMVDVVSPLTLLLGRTS